MEVLRYINVVILGLLGLIITFANWIAIFSYLKDKGKQFSLLPILGGLCLCVAFVIIPNNSYVWLCWIGLIIDFGCLPMVIRALWYYKKISIMVANII